MSYSGVKPPTVRLRRLSAELRRLRDHANLEREQVADRTGINGVTLYRIETAQARPQKRTLVALLDLYQVENPLRSDLLALAANAAEKGWLRPYQADLPGEYGAYISFESEARALRNYESLFVPGLMQTPEYAHAVVRGAQPPVEEAVVLQRVQARLERQRLLGGDEPLDLWVVIDEAAVRREVGGVAVMAAQVDHLIEMMERPNISLQVIPFGAGAHPGMPGSFVHMEFRDQLAPELVYIDTMAGDLFVEDDEDLARYRKMFEILLATAVSQKETIRLLSSVAASLKGG